MSYFSKCKAHWSCLVLIAGLMASIHASFAATNEQTLTVAFLYNFLKFTEWPASSLTGGELTICITDSTPFREELGNIAGRSAQNKTVRIKQIELGESPSVCHLMFLPREEKPVRIREWIKNTDTLPVLMVSNMDEFLDMGGMIMLIDDDNRLLFDVNLDPVKRSGLKLSAQLLKIAHKLKGN